MTREIYRLEKSNSSNAINAKADAELTCTKIYYASRTHSQLSQVLQELQKLNISLSPSSVVSMHSQERDKYRPQRTQQLISVKRDREFLEADENDDETLVDVRVVSLASRKQLCVNEKLRAKSTDLDEACRQRLSGAHDYYDIDFG